MNFSVRKQIKCLGPLSIDLLSSLPAPTNIGWRQKLISNLLYFLSMAKTTEYDETDHYL